MSNKPKLSFDKSNNNWNLCNFLETCIVVGGATYKSDDVVNKPNDNTYTILRSNNIKNGFLNLDDLVFIKNDRKYKKEFIQKGDILVCSNNGSKKLIGKNCLIENEMPNTLFGGFMMVFRNSQPLIRYFIQTKIFKRLISNSIGQINSITKNSLKNINLYLPSLQEQKQIAHFLETIDNTILTLQDQLKQTEQLKKYYLDKLFPKNNKDIPELRFKEFNKRERWTLVPLSTIGEIKTGKTPSTKNELFWNGSIPFVTPTDIGDNIYSIHTERNVTIEGSQKSTLVPKNSILCTCIASIGKNCIVPINSCFNQQINSISVNNQYDYLFVYYALSQNVDKLISTASQGTILILPKSKFLNIEILVTKLNEQLKISNFLKQIDNLKSTINTQLNNLNQVKQYYLKNMFV